MIECAWGGNKGDSGRDDSQRAATQPGHEFLRGVCDERNLSAHELTRGFGIATLDGQGQLWIKG